ncbi:MAG: DUF2794 domain-containing protein [Pseudomonadota bacterium]
MADGEEASRVVPLRPHYSVAAKAISTPKTVAAQKPVAPLIAFHRTELSEILKVYGRMVAAGEWRDYALDHGRDQAVFSIYRRMGEVPMYRITKTPRNARKNGTYAVLSSLGVVLKRGHELAQVLRVFERKRHLTLVSE